MIGIFYLLAFVASVVAVILYTPTMAEDWYMAVINGQENSILFGVLFDLILLVSAVGTTVTLAPYLSQVDRQLSFAYYSFRFWNCLAECSPMDHDSRSQPNVRCQHRYLCLLTEKRTASA